MRQRLPAWGSSVAVAVALVALVAWSFWQRWQLLTESPFPLGVDGYFYPIQLRSLLAHGELAYPASPLAFYLLAPFAAATDPVTGAKLGAALLGAAVAGPAYGTGVRLGGSRGAGLVAAVLATTSMGSAYLTIEFVKNGIGLTVALTALWLVLAATERPSRPRIAAALLTLVAAYATHKMAAAIVLVVAIPAALAALASRGGLRGRRLACAAGGLAVLGALVLALGAVFPQRLLSATDATLVAGLVSATPHWTAPALVFPTGELTLGHDAVLGSVLAWIGAIALGLLARTTAHQRAETAPPSATTTTQASTLTTQERVDLRSTVPVPPRSREGNFPPIGEGPAKPGRSFTTGDRASRHTGEARWLPIHATMVSPPAAAPPSAAIRAATWPILLLAIGIGLPFLAVTDRQGLGFRLRIAAFVPAALTAAIVARALLARFVHRNAVLAALALVLAVVRQPGTWLPGEVVTHPALVAAAQALNGRVPAGATLIVPERHIAFLVAWYTGAPVAIRPDQIPPARRIRLLPLHFIGADSALDRQLFAARAEPSLPTPIGVHPRHPNGLVLVAEPTWEWILDRLPEAERAHFRAWPTI
ncbi:MAG TPA: hypothetical protein VHN14_13520 [Kofleriaceae bacterium]|nr:hypothetical protein [Kofleriaceae bacterium]